jgi:hypothetical protein
VSTSPEELRTRAGVLRELADMCKKERSRTGHLNPLRASLGSLVEGLTSRAEVLEALAREREAYLRTLER